jgi:Uma2 family endonuclease
MVLPTITDDRIDLYPGDELILRYRSWADYQELLDRRPDKAGWRIRYSAKTGEIRIMSPLPRHGNFADVLADCIKAMLRQQGKDWQAFTPITLRRVGLQGVEPDYCFYIQNRSQILGNSQINLDVVPPPDLVIEVDLTSATRPEDYEAIGAPELWIYRQKELLIYLFDGQQYQESQTSRQFPNIDVKTLIPDCIDRAWQIGSSVALREFEQHLAENFQST